MENPIENNALRIETIRTPEGSEVSVCPQRGGIITSIKFQGREILYLDPGTLIIDLSPEYKKIWIWSMVGKDFICIEPIMRDAGGLIENPENIPPKKTLHTRVNFKLKE